MMPFLVMKLVEVAAFLNSLNRNVWSVIFAVLATIVAGFSIKNHELFSLATALLGVAAAAFNGKE